MEPGTTINESQYTGVITWTPADSTFAPSTIYEAEVVLTATTGYTFDGVGANSFIYAYAGATATNPAGSGNTITVTISFPATAADMVSDLDLTMLITAPVKHMAPGTTINESQYTGVITWAPADSTFAPSTVYEAEVVLTATTGYTFTGVNANSFNYTYAGTMATNPAGSGDTITVTITFPATAADVVSAFDLTALVAAPAKGATPNTTPISVAQFTGTVTWKKADGTTVTGNFASATIYQATVSLSAETGYTFTGVNANSFTHTYAGASATNPAGSGDTITVTITFPATASPEYAITVDPDAGDGAFSQETFTVSKGGGGSQTITVTDSADYTNPRWFVDGDLKGTATSITIGAADYSAGNHNLTLLITKSGVSWSKEITFTVTD
jgi:hypothetical protein